MTWIRLTDAAFALRVTYRRAYDLAIRGELEARRAGAGWEVSQESVDRMKRERARTSTTDEAA